MTHAYMIMAHTQPELLKKLIACLDYCDNDIILHLDKKALFTISDMANIVKKGKLFFTEQINVSWGGYSQIEAELILLRKSLEIGHHDFYHLLTGNDLPIKPINQINTFYEKNIGKEFVHFTGKKFSDKNFEGRIKYKHYFREKCGRDKNIYTVLNKIGIIIQKIIRREKSNMRKADFYIGSAYWDISEDLANYIIEHSDDIYRIYKYSNCCDEAFVQSLL